MQLNIQFGKKTALTVIFASIVVMGSATVEFRDSGAVNFFSDLDLNSNSVNSVDSLDAQNLDTQNIDTVTINGRTIDELIPDVSSNGGGIYGDGSDGEIVRTSGGSEPELLLAERFVIKDGVNRNVDRVTVIHATESIIINGTLNAKGQGASGNSCTYCGGFNARGGDGQVASGGDGGNGGYCYYDHPKWRCIDTSRWSGGNQQMSSSQIKLLRIFDSTSYDSVYDFSIVAGSGGAVGHMGQINNPPYRRVPGGDGGNGGGTVLLVAPEVKINGKVLANGEDGGDGSDGNCIDGDDFSRSSGSAWTPSGGGGGGGSGGLVIVNSPNIEGSSNIDVSGGAGGDPGENGCGKDSDGNLIPENGGQGQDGEDGELIILN